MTMSLISLRVSVKRPRPHSSTNLLLATWGGGAMCGFIKMTETLIISHKLVKQKAREKTTSVEVAFGE